MATHYLQELVVRESMRSPTIDEIFFTNYDCFQYPKYDIISIDLKKEVKKINNEGSCFCGSGISSDRCHPSVNPDSLLASVLEKYHILDSLVENAQKDNGVKPLCKKGCNDCCNDYFYISSAEYFAIKNYLSNKNKNLFKHCIEKGKKTYNDLKNHCPEEYNRLETSGMDKIFNDKDYLKCYKLCPFVDENNGACMVYKVRPIACRMYGTSYMSGICDTIYKKTKRLFSQEISKNKICKHLVGINYRHDDIQENVKYYVVPNSSNANAPKVLIEQGYPIIYYLCHDSQFNLKYHLSYTIGKKEYIEEYTETAGILLHKKIKV